MNDVRDIHGGVIFGTGLYYMTMYQINSNALFDDLYAKLRPKIFFSKYLNIFFNN